MANRVGLLRGIAAASILYPTATSQILLPFNDSITEATAEFTGELVSAQTFSEQGVLGISSACLASEGLTFSLNSQDVTWSMLQSYFLTQASTLGIPLVTEEVVTLSDVDATPVSTYTLQGTPVTVAADLEANNLPVSGVVAADEDGTQYAITVTGSNVEFDDDYTGTKVTFRYLVAASSQQVIQVGKGERLSVGGFVGKFITCGEEILIVAPKVAVLPSGGFTVDGNTPASVGVQLTAIRTDGRFADVIRLNSGT